MKKIIGSDYKLLCLIFVNIEAYMLFLKSASIEFHCLEDIRRKNVLKMSAKMS